MGLFVPLLGFTQNAHFTPAEVGTFVHSQPQFVACCYATASSPLHWLIFATKFDYQNAAGFRPKSFLLKLRAINRRHASKLYPVHQVGRETIYKRVSGFQVETLQHKTCLVLGCGALGSRVAETLCKAGVGQLILVDHDILRAGNLARHVLGVDYLGWNKAFALRNFLLKKNPFAQILAEDATFDLVNQPTRYEELLAQCDLVISCLGNDATETFVNLGAVTVKKPVFWARAYLQGRLGEILSFTAQEDCACFQCAALYLQTPGCVIPRPPQIPYQELVKFDGDCGTAFLPASAVDLDFTALHTARLALQRLQGDPAENNYWLVRGREFTPSERETLDPTLVAPFQISGWRIPCSPTCQFCQPAEERNAEVG